MELLIDPDFVPGATLCEDESRHCVKVMRHRVGDTVFVSDGCGKRYECKIADANARGCMLEIVKCEELPEPTYSLHMAVAPTKNIDRFEWFVEKAVEIGVAKITPIYCDHSERTTLRTDRLRRIVMAAAKQSLKSYLPEVTEPVSCTDLIASAEEDQRFILHCEEGEKEHLFNACQTSRSTLVLVGPEGDFSAKEIGSALSHGFVECSLGKERLRTETAAVVATDIVSIKNQVG